MIIKQIAQTETLPTDENISIGLPKEGKLSLAGNFFYKVFSTDFTTSSF